MITLIAQTNSLVVLKCGALFPQRTLTFESLTDEQRNEALYLQSTGALLFVEEKTPVETAEAHADETDKEPAEKPDTEKAASTRRRPPLFLPPNRG